MAKDVTIEIGFSGGGSTGFSVPDDHLERFTSALKEGQSERWYTVESTDGAEIIVDLSSVVFLRVGSRGRSIGFGQ